MVNEFVIQYVMVLIFAFTNWVPDGATRNSVGLAVLGLLAFNIFYNMGYLLVLFLKFAYLRSYIPVMRCWIKTKGVC